MKKGATHKYMPVRGPKLLRDTREMVAYVDGYILAMQDVLNDNDLLVRTQPGYTSPWQLIEKVTSALESAKRTFSIVQHDEEVGSDDT